MRIRNAILLLMVLSFLFITAPILPVKAQATAYVVIGTTDSITNLDPADAYDYFSSNTIVQITHGLMEMPVGSTTAEEGPIVESHTVSTDAKVYTFTLKQGIKFSDGTDFDAEAMKWNLDRALALAAESEPGFLLSDVIDKVEATDDYEIKITLSVADATFLQRLTYTVAWPVSPNGALAADEISGDPQHIPAGLGPYMITAWTKDTELVLAPNPYYFGTAPKNTQVVIKFYTDASTLLTALENGDIDVAHRQFGPDEIEDVMANANLEYKTKDTAGIRYLLINVEEHTEIQVRRAIAAAVNRTQITSTVFADLSDPLFSMVPTIFDSHIDAFADGPIQTDVAGNMTDAGYSTSNKYEIDLWYTPSHYGTTEKDVAELIQQQLEATNYFDVTLKSAEWSTYIDTLETLGFFLLGWWFDYPDPSNYIDPFVGAGAFSLGTNYTSAAMNDSIDTMLTDPDVADRTQAIKDAQELMAVDVPLVPLFTMIKQFVAYHPDITGIVLEPSENMHYNSIVGFRATPGFELLTTLAILVIFGAGLLVYRKRKKK